MKLELEPQDIEAIAQRVLDLLIDPEARVQG
jgi:hypothetical protein